MNVKKTSKSPPPKVPRKCCFPKGFLVTIIGAEKGRNQSKDVIFAYTAMLLIKV